MNYNLKGTGVVITDELRTYIEKKLAHADKLLAGDTVAHTDVELEYAPVLDGGRYRAEFTVTASGAMYRTEQWGTTLHEAIDIAVDEAIKDIRRSKKKHLRLVRHGATVAKDVLRGLRKKF